MAMTSTQLEQAIYEAIANDDLKRLEDLEKCFELSNEVPDVPFSAPVKLKKSAVKDASAFAESDTALTWANSISNARRNILFRRKLNQGYAGPIIVGEGDSWFQYPLRIDDVIDHLMEEFAVYSVAAAGDLIANMAEQDEISAPLAAENAQFLILSGGGNDMLHDGNFANFLNEFEAGMSADDVFLEGAVSQFLDQMLQVYRSIVERAGNESPNVRILLHGYDYVVPVQGGKWLGGPLGSRGVPKAMWGDLVAKLIDRFNVRLKTLESLFPGRVYHIDCRGSVPANMWHDELHPTSAGFAFAAEQFAERIRAVWSANEIMGTTELASVPASKARLEVPVETKRQLAMASQLISRPDQAAAIMKSQIATTPVPAAKVLLNNGEAIISNPTERRIANAAPLPSPAELAAWRQLFSQEDLVAYRHYAELKAREKEPEDPEVLAARAEMLAGGDAFNLERIIGDNDLFQINFLSRGERAAKAVGRIAVISPLGVPRGFGTGFLVAPGLLLTNNHVLSESTAAQKSHVLFEYEYDADNALKQTERFELNPRLFFTSKDFDFAFVGVAPVGRGGRKLEEFGHLQLIPGTGKAIKAEYVSIIQHPSSLPKQIAVRDSQILGRVEKYVYYTTDTNPGSSGAPVVNDHWLPVALHHRSVPDFDKPNAYACNRGIRISAIFDELRRAATRDSGAAAVLRTLSGAETKGPGADSPIVFAPVADGIGNLAERVKAPIHDPFDAAHPRGGYDANFLGIKVSLPDLIDASQAAPRLDNGSPILTYEHFSIVMSKQRRMAFFTASNVDAANAKKRPEPGRDYSRKGLGGLGANDTEQWFPDPRLDAKHQLPDRFYTEDGNAFDRGHLVRREDVTWGDSYDQVRRGNGDTFHMTNCSPQVGGFNRSNLGGLWGELENIVLSQARTERYCLFAGPVLDPADRVFRGKGPNGELLRAQIPSKFWKVVVARDGNRLKSFAFLLEQDLSAVPLEFDVSDAWKQRMVSVASLETLVRFFRFPDAVRQADQFASQPDSGEVVFADGAADRFRRI